MATEIKVPDIGDFKDVPVIEILVAVGDKVNVDDPLVSLESDKATMEVPSTAAGIVESIAVKIGDRVSEGATIIDCSAIGRGRHGAAPLPGRAAGAGAFGRAAACRGPRAGGCRRLQDRRFLGRPCQPLRPAPRARTRRRSQ
ncbi:MAG: hypothetical protein QM773_18780 [Hyphomonadaceae bacterium]